VRIANVADIGNGDLQQGRERRCRKAFSELTQPSQSAGFGRHNVEGMREWET
jgi:hypothetical protein